MKQTVCIAMAFGKKAAKEILDSINHYCQSSRPTVKQKGTDVFYHGMRKSPMNLL